MDDKTKALDIAMSLIDCELPTLEKCRKSAIQMAEWKDQQFQEEKKQLIEKAAKWLDDNQRVYREYDESGFYHEKSQHLIKDFKQVMEE